MESKGAKRKAFSIEEKVNLIKEIEKGKTKSAVARAFGVSNSTLHTIWNDKQKILTAFENNETNSKKLRKAVLADVDDVLYKWCQEQRAMNMPISGPILKLKAIEIAKSLGIENFFCSNGWLSRFKLRHRIVFRKNCGEPKSSDENADEWLRSVWPNVRKDFKDEDIFNADETGLFYRVLPNNTLKFINEKCVDGKLSKERITVLCCANMTGTEKRKLMVIGKSQKPRSFENVNNMPNVSYYANKNAWMTAALFENELRNWDEELSNKNRKILLMVDNCPAHSVVEGLQNIKLVFLPSSNVILQPMQQGIIQNLKSYYRQSILLMTIEAMDKNEQIAITVLDAMKEIESAWDKVSSTTIQNCYSHAGFKPKTDTCENNVYDVENLILLAQLNVILKKTRNFEDFNFRVFVGIDDEILTCDLQSETDMNDEIKHGNSVVESDSESEEEGVSEIHPTISDALAAIKILEKFTEVDADAGIYKTVCALKKDIQKMFWRKKCESKQTQILDGFNVLEKE